MPTQIVSAKEREEAKKVQEELNMQKYDGIWKQIEEQIQNDVSSGEKGTEIEIIEKLIVDIKGITLAHELDKKGEKEILKRMKVRVKDIKEILLDTGIGKDGYSIIEQGKVDEILSNNPVNRRKVFDEAGRKTIVGITKACSI